MYFNGIIPIFYKTALFAALEIENYEIIKLLLANDKIDINYKRKIDNRTALHLAVQINNVAIIKLLLEKKDIDINSKDLRRKKPIDYSKSEEVRQLLSQAS